MSYYFHYAGVIVFLLAAIPLRADETPRPTAPADQVLLLRNGQALRGKITHAGDYYFVTLASGEIRLKADQVDLICRNLEEGYAAKRGGIDPTKVNDHLDLAQWCLEHELYEGATAELADAEAIDRSNARLALIKRQMELARQRPGVHDRKLAAADKVLTNEELDRLVRGMPHGTVEMFSTAIQPLLLNTCTTSGCHGVAADNRLRLLRLNLGKSASRRLTQRNLHAVMQLIDRNNPSASPLLQVPIAPHGTSKNPIFTSKEAVQYRQLVVWVSRVTNAPTTEQPTSVEKPNDTLSQRFSTAPAIELDASFAPNPAHATSGAGAGRVAPTAKSDEPATSASGKRTARKIASPEMPADDPFDPDLFNRRYFPRR